MQRDPSPSKLEREYIITKVNEYREEGLSFEFLKGGEVISLPEFNELAASLKAMNHNYGKARPAMKKQNL